MLVLVVKEWLSKAEEILDETNGNTEPPLMNEQPTHISSSDEDRLLVERAQNGDTKAFDDLVRKYTPKIYGLVYNMTSNRDDTADLLQDIFAKAYRSLIRFMGKSSFYTWLYSIAVNMTLNFLKKRKQFI
jgi:RNA polymerase sigma-70 factor (ECF subfamily)